MQIEEFKGGGLERTLLIASIVSKDFLAKLTTNAAPLVFRSSYANKIFKWCTEHYEKFHDAPGMSIETRYEEYLNTSNDPSTSRLIGDLLSHLNEEYVSYRAGLNVEYLLERAASHFKEVHLLRHQEALQGDLAQGKVDEADNRARRYAPLEMGGGSAVRLFTDEEDIRQACAEESAEPLVLYPGPLGRFFGSSLERDGFVAFLAPQKASKSYWLLDVAYRAATQRRMVLYFQVGDMSSRQAKRRFYTRAARWPSRRAVPSWDSPAVIRVPKKIVRLDDPGGGRDDFNEPYFHIDYETKEFPHPITPFITTKAMKGIMAKQVRSKRSPIDFYYYPTKGVSVHTVRSDVENWIAKEDGRPVDLVVIDYADNLLPVNHKAEVRDQYEYTWAVLRQISERYHCLLVTATQANREGGRLHWLQRENISEEIRKANHVTGMVGINASRLEKEHGVKRLNWIVLREGDYATNDGPAVAGCLALANPAVCSMWRDE